MSITTKSVLKWSIVLILDLIVFLFLGVLLMDYDDFYQETKGEYGSFASMTPFQKSVEISFDIWVILNFILLFLIVKKFWKSYNKNK